MKLPPGAPRLRRQILDFPGQFTAGAELARGLRVARPSELVIAGMGGSALFADLLLAHLGDELRLPVRVHRSYGLPARTDPRALVLCSSYSGGTEETLSAFSEALRRRLPVLVFSHGGELLRLARARRFPAVVVPECAQPRYSPGYLFGALHEVLSSLGLTHACREELARLTAFLRKQKLEPEGKRIARALKGAIPLVYSTPEYAAAARTSKIKFNENSKTPAFHNSFPELNHNEMVGFTRSPAKFHALLLTDGHEETGMARRIRATADVLRDRGLGVTEVRLKGTSHLERMFYATTLFDWASYHLALENGVDPLPVQLVERFKERLRI
jgi:glucose/mannose-6-phosphate isomerase